MELAFSWCLDHKDDPGVDDKLPWGGEAEEEDPAVAVEWNVGEMATKFETLLASLKHASAGAGDAMSPQLQTTPEIDTPGRTSFNKTMQGAGAVRDEHFVVANDCVHLVADTSKQMLSAIQALVLDFGKRGRPSWSEQQTDQQFVQNYQRYHP